VVWVLTLSASSRLRCKEVQGGLHVCTMLNREPAAQDRLKEESLSPSRRRNIDRGPDGDEILGARASQGATCTEAANGAPSAVC
jgi:hypothetical protein